MGTGPAMSRNSRTVHASPAAVWEVLADGWQYAGWVVGASRVRAVDEAWPGLGSRIHHSVGLWPAVIDDHTEVTEAQPGSRLTLRARGWPAGEAQVRIQLRPAGPDTEVVLEEDAVAGPGRLVPGPLRDLLIGWRNTETLRRLAMLAERAPAPDASGAHPVAARKDDA